MPQLTLYYSPGPSSMATHVALHEVGAPFELKLIQLYRNEQPCRRVPRGQPRGQGADGRQVLSRMRSL
jgi:glutathione S-transferase